MLLAIDAGNTRIKWGRFGPAGRDSDGALLHAELPRLFAADVPPRVIVSNVAGPHIETQLREQCDLAEVQLHVIQSRPVQCGVTSRYRNPAQLGTDRWAALIAAHHVARRNQLVVMAGTAMTVDALTADGTFLGGLIVPGMALMRQALNQNTAQLGPEAGEFAEFPGATPDAITSGVIQASAGAVERMFEILRDTGGAAPAVVISGGAAAALMPHLPPLPEPATLREHLVLDGLAVIAAEVWK